LQKRAGIWGNFGLCWRGSQAVAGVPDENRLTVCEQARRAYHGAVFEIKKEIPTYAFRVGNIRELGLSKRKDRVGN